MFFKKILLIIFIIFVVKSVYSQKTELSINANTGMFYFRGAGATSNAILFISNEISTSSYTSNPYGNKSAFSYALELEVKRIKKNNNIYGFGINYESLTSKADINKAVADIIMMEYNANGNETLHNTFITFNPFIGHRFFFHKMFIDLLPNIDIAINIKSIEDINANYYNNKSISVKSGITTPSIDIKPGIKLKAGYKKYGLLLGYAIGVTNYQPDNNPKAFSNYINLGFSYQIQ